MVAKNFKEEDMALSIFVHEEGGVLFKDMTSQSDIAKETG